MTNLTEKLRRAIIWLRRQLVVTSNRVEIVYKDGRITTLQGAKPSTEKDTTRAARRRRQSYQLRYRVYCREKGGQATPEEHRERRQKDRYDEYADYIMVVRSYRVWPFGRPLLGTVVGVYRLLPQSHLPNESAFYTAEEYDLSALFQARSHIGNGMVEVSRSCVHARYRRSGVLDLLWEGCTLYLAENRILTLFGTVSFWTQAADEIEEELSYLAHCYSMPGWCTMRALPDSASINMLRVPAAGLEEKKIRPKLPTLIKGYIMLGGRFGEGAYLDKVSRTIDVAVMVFVEDVKGRIIKKFDTTGTLQRVLQEDETQEQLRHYRNLPKR
jgi:putative hemolysin